MRRVAVFALLGLFLLAPIASAESLADELGKFHFARLVFTVQWGTKDDHDHAYVIASAQDLAIEGDAASQLRHCIDGQDCSVPQLSAAASGADRDGTVSSDEAKNFALNVQLGISTTSQYKEFRKTLAGIVRIDDKNATSIALSGIGLRGAEGSVDSTKTVFLTIEATAKYATVLPAEEHHVAMQRATANFTIADRIIVDAGPNWQIEDGTIQPDQMRQFLGHGRLEGSQEEFQSTEPLAFTIQHHENHASTWVLWGGISVIAIVAAAGGYLFWARKV